MVRNSQEINRRTVAPCPPIFESPTQDEGRAYWLNHSMVYLLNETERYYIPEDLSDYSIRLVDTQGGHETFGEYPLNVNL
jgi:hypothetical protein